MVEASANEGLAGQDPILRHRVELCPGDALCCSGSFPDFTDLPGSPTAATGLEASGGVSCSALRSGNRQRGWSRGASGLGQLLLQLAEIPKDAVVANVPLTFDPADVDSDGTASPACTVAPGGNFLEQGLNNAATLTDPTGGTVTDTDCAGLPSTKVSKVMDGAPVKGANGHWTVNYTLTVFNDGAVQGLYTLTDQLRYGAGIEVLKATVTSAPEGVTPAATWTGQGAKDAAENVVATDVALAAGGSHVYRVTIETSLDTAAADGTTLTCPAPGSDDRGGFANTAGVGHNDLTADASACDVPEWPEDVPPPLATTGGTIAVGAVGAAVLLLIAGGVLLYARRRRVAAE